MAYIVTQPDTIPIGKIHPRRVKMMVGQVTPTIPIKPTSGNGYLAGEFPEGITTEEGAPVSATVRILYRPAAGALGDGMVVAEVQSAPDGSWLIQNLNENFKYDVVGRKTGFNDVIMANVSPVSMVVISYSGAITADADFTGATGFIDFIGGIPPYSAAALLPLPSGLTPEISGNRLTVTGTTLDDAVFNSSVQVTSSNGATVTVPMKIVAGFKAPTDLAAKTLEAAGVFSVSLTWAGLSATTEQVKIYRSIAPFDMEALPLPWATLSGTATSYIDDAVAEDNEFYYMVASVCEGFTLYSDEVREVVIAGDRHWNNVVSLLRFDGDLTDETGRTWIAITGPTFESGGVDGSAALSSAVYTQYSAELDIVNADFTIEFYVRSDSWATWVSDGSGFLPNAFGKMEHNTNTNYWSFGPNGLGQLAFYAYDNNRPIRLFSTDTVPVGVLTHVALMRQGNQMLMSIGGNVEVVGSVGAIALGGATPFSVGRYLSRTRVGLQDELRITKGVARYTENFTPPTEPFPNFGPFSPRDIAPALWLDAADSGSTTLVSGAVTNWQNKGNALGNFSQSTASARPIVVESALADLPVVRFDGSNDQLTSSDTALRSMFTNTGNGWAFVVFCRRSTSAKTATIFQSRTSNGTSGRFACYAGANVAGYYNSATVLARRLDSDSAQFIRSPVSYGTDWTMALFRTDWATGELSIVIDGGAPTVGVLGSAGTTANTLGAYVTIGAEGNTNHGDIDLAELTAGSGNPLTQSDTDNLFGYAAWKWGLVDKLPEDHPYKHQKPNKKVS